MLKDTTAVGNGWSFGKEHQIVLCFTSGSTWQAAATGSFKFTIAGQA